MTIIEVLPRERHWAVLLPFPRTSLWQYEKFPQADKTSSQKATDDKKINDLCDAVDCLVRLKQFANSVPVFFELRKGYDLLCCQNTQMY